MMMFPEGMQHVKGIPAEEAMSRLVDGNRLFVETGMDSGNYSEERRIDTADNGQHPYAVIISCSDSRVIPEAIFSAGIGDLFVIRSAGNTIDTCALGSIEYAVEHLGCNLVVVLGHTGCGAVSAALRDHRGLKVTSILDDIRDAACGETDHTRVAEMNALRSVKVISDDLIMDEGVLTVGAIYDIREGTVRFLQNRF
jgi:carbonic anhydrase